MSAYRGQFLNRVNLEREHQIENGYGAVHDARHSPSDWVCILARYVGKLGDDFEVSDFEAARDRLVKIGAISCALYEHMGEVEQGEF